MNLNILKKTACLIIPLAFFAACNQHPKEGTVDESTIQTTDNEQIDKGAVKTDTVSIVKKDSSLAKDSNASKEVVQQSGEKKSDVPRNFIRSSGETSPALPETPIESGVNYYDIGIKKYEQKDYAGSIDAFDKEILLHPSNSEAYYRRGLAKMDI